MRYDWRSDVADNFQNERPYITRRQVVSYFDNMTNTALRAQQYDGRALSIQGLQTQDNRFSTIATRHAD